MAFVVACISHEVIGHGGACLASGGTVTRLSSVYFNCSDANPFVDAAGPSANLVMGAVCWCLLRIRATTPSIRFFLVLVMAFDFFWGAGYFIFSAALNEGDWAWFLRGLELKPPAAWRAFMGAFGIVLYAGSVRLVSRNWPGGISSVVPWLAAGVVACCSTFFYFGPTLPALREAAQESFLAAIGLLALARRAPGRSISARSILALDGNGWILTAMLVVIAFWLTLGRGFGAPTHV